MANARDIELSIRARNLTGATLQQVSQAVDNLTNKLREQETAAARGEASVKELEGTLAALARTDAQLARQAGSVARFQELTAQLEQQRAAAVRSREAFQQIEQSLNSLSNAQRRRNAEFAAAKTAAGSDERAVRQTENALRRQSEALEKAGIDTRNLTAAENELAAAAERVGQARQRASQAVQNFPAQQRAIQQQTAALRELEAEEQRVTAARAKRAAEERQFQQQRDQAARQLRESQLVQTFTPVLDLEDAKARLRSDLAAFRQQAESAIARPSTLRVPAASIAAESTVAAAVERIVAPAQAARRTLAGVEEQIATLTAQAARGGQPIQAYADTLRNLEQAQRTLVQQGGMVDAFRNQVAAVRAARAQFEQARETVKQIAEQIRTSNVVDPTLTSRLQQAQAALRQFDEQTRSGVARARELRQALRDAGIETRGLADSQGRLLAAAQKVRPEVERLRQVVQAGVSPGGPPTLFGLRPYQLQNLSFQVNDVVTQLASGTSVMQTLAQQGGQIMQIFPNAFTTVLRLLPAIVAIGGAAVVSISAVNRLLETQAALRGFQGLLAASADGFNAQSDALVRAQRSAERYGATFDDAGKAIREFLQNGINPERLQQFLKLTQDIVDVYGGKFPDVAKTVAEAFSGNAEALLKLNSQYNVLSGSVAKAVLDAIQEGDIVRARGLVFDEFVRKVDEGARLARGPWTEASRAFKAAFSELLDVIGNSAIVAGSVDVLARAISRLTSSMKGASESSLRGKIAEETAAIAQAQGLLATLDRRPSREQAAGVTRDQLRKEISDRFAAIEQLKKAIEQVNQTTQQAQQAATQAAGAFDTGQQGLVRTTEAQNTAGRRYLDTLREELFLKRKLDTLNKQEIERRIEIVRRQAEEKARKETPNESIVGQAGELAALEERNRIQEELAKKGSAIDEKRKTLAQELAEFLRKTEAQITRDTAAGLDERLALFDTNFAKILRKLSDFAKNGGKEIEGIPLEQFRERLLKAVEAARETEKVKFFGEAIRDISRVQQEFTRSVTGEIRSGTVSLAEGFELLTSNAKLLNPELVKLAKATLEIFEAQKKAGTLTPQLALEAARSRAILNARGAAEPGTGTTESVANAALEAGFQKLQQLLEIRTQTLREQQTLVENFATSSSAAEEKIQAAYAKTNEPIRQQVELLRQQVEKMNEMGVLVGPLYDLWIAKIDAAAAQTERLSPAVKQLAENIQQALVTGASTFFKDSAKALGEFIAGTKSTSQAFADLGRATLNFFATFLQKIGEAILQMAILRALGLPTGGAGAGGGGAVFALADFITKLFHTGGVAGHTPTTKRAISPAWFADAPRLHSGGLAGLRRDEIPAILQRGEEVLRKDDPRNILMAARQGGASGPQEISIKNVLVDSPERVAGALQTPAGERVVMSILRNNASTLRTLVRA